MSDRILLSGGGTAGSVTPLLALVQEIRRRRDDVEFRFVGTSTGPERALVEAANVSFEAMNGGKLRRYWSWKNISDLGQLWRGYTQAKKIIRDWKPAIAMTAGSFVSVPIIWAAHRQGVPTLIHQQDIRTGLANRLMAPAADVVTTAFQASVKFFPQHKATFIGNPVRPEILMGNVAKAKEFFHLTGNDPVLLVLGGATGSVALNTVMAGLAEKLSKDWQIIHLTGSQRGGVISNNPRYHCFPFLTSEMPGALAVADVVVSRAGLGMISELAALSKSTIFIPMPETHQEDNAKVISDTGAGIVLDQRNNIEKKLAEAIEQLRQNPAERTRLGNNLKQFYTADALSHLADEVLHLMKA